MALTNTCVRFLIWAKKKGVSFEHTLTLGHLDNMTTQETISALSIKQPQILDFSKINWKNKYADSIISAFGATEVQSLDKSDYEHASLLYDLNLPLPSTLHGRFSLLIDGGTLEHVFNFPQAILSSMKTLRTGGHFIGFSPVNNLMGHGFYQFSPELMYRIFSSANGFKIKGVFLVAADFSIDCSTWYEVKDPASIKERIELTNTNPTYMMVLAEKIAAVEELNPVVFQSDYLRAWYEEEAQAPVDNDKKESLLKKIERRLLKRQKQEEDLEKINPLFFKKKKFE